MSHDDQTSTTSMTQGTTRYQGGCHCGAVRYEVDLDLARGTSRCNCSYCAITRGWTAIVKPAQFRLLCVQESLTDYQFGARVGHYVFCKHCGVRPFGHGTLDVLGGEFVSINLHTVADLDPTGVPVVYLDGRHDTWAVLASETLGPEGFGIRP